MSEVEKYIDKKEATSPGFRKKIDEEYKNLRIGELIRQLRLSQGMTQEELARRLSTTKSAVSRLENHSESVRLATIEKVAEVFGKKLILDFQ